MIDFNVDMEKCVQCGLCAKDCVFNAIALDPETEIPMLAVEERCIGCQHCLAICPTGALSIFGNSPEDSTVIRNAFPSEESMITLIKGRRSVRDYKPENIEPEVLDRVMETVWHAPTGVNRQQVLVTMTENREQTAIFRDEIVNRIVSDVESGNLPQGPMAMYMGMVADAHKNGVDMLFRGAPHVIITSGPKDMPSTPADTVILLSYLDLLAPAMGLGTLWNGILKACISVAYPDLKEMLGIPENHEVGYAMLLGKPATSFARTVERKNLNLNRVTF